MLHLVKFAVGLVVFFGILALGGVIVGALYGIGYGLTFLLPVRVASFGSEEVLSTNDHLSLAALWAFLSTASILLSCLFGPIVYNLGDKALRKIQRK